MKPVLQWLKRHTLIVVFCVIIVASLGSMPFIAAGMNAAVREDVNARAQKLNQLSQLERTQISVPGESGVSKPGVVNPQLLQQYREVVNTAQRDAEEVYEKALEFNRKDHALLMPALFPEPPSDQRETMPFHFWEQLMAAYDQLLIDIGVGQPPDPAALRQELRRREVQFRAQYLNREADEALTAEEQAELEKQLRALRLQRYTEVAESIRLYMAKETLNLPPRPQSLPSIAEMFEWQYRYWIHTDLLRAMERANADDPSVLTAPVKHVLAMTLAPPPEAASGGGADGGPTRGGGRGMPGGGPIGVGAGGAPPSAGGSNRDPVAELPTTPPANPRTAVPSDYTVSFTGRRSNDLYDVRYVNLQLVVESERIPEVLDALAQQNFITVINMAVTPADPYEAARQGYVYGNAPVATLSLQLEMVYLRQWIVDLLNVDNGAAVG